MSVIARWARRPRQTGLRFLTALTTTEFDKYASALPHASFASLDVSPELDKQACIKEAAQRAVKAGMRKEAEDLFVLNLGVVERHDKPPSASDTTRVASTLAEIMKLVRDINEEVDVAGEQILAVARRPGHQPKVAGRDVAGDECLPERACVRARRAEATDPAASTVPHRVLATSQAGADAAPSSAHEWSRSQSAIASR